MSESLAFHFISLFWCSDTFFIPSWHAALELLSELSAADMYRVESASRGHMQADNTEIKVNEMHLANQCVKKNKPMMKEK